MKLLYIANIRLPTEKAHGIQIMKMCEAFADAGAMVELVVPWRFNPITEDPFIYYGVEKNFIVKKVPSIDLVRFGKIGFLMQVFSFTASACVFLFFRKCDVVYSRDEIPLFFISLFKKNVFWETHRANTSFFSRHVWKRAVGIISITGKLKDFYCEQGVSPAKIAVAHDAVDIASFRAVTQGKDALRSELDLPHAKKIISYVGKYKTMGRGKGVEGLIRAFTQVAHSHEDVFLLIVGVNNNEIGEVRALCASCGINAGQYKIVPHIKHNTVVRYLKASDVLVMNYPNDAQYALFTSPMKLFEYMASGNPIVASDLPGIREVLNEKNAILVKLENELDLTEGMMKALADEELGKALSSQAWADVQQYTWEQRAKNILSFMQIRRI